MRTVMTIQILDIGPDDLGRYAQVPSTFEVSSILRPELLDGGLGGIRLREERVDPPWLKDYDAHEEGGIERWPQRFDTRNWGFFLAVEGERPVGAAAVAYDTPGVNMLAGRRDLAVLWDIRVHPEHRHRGIGKHLFGHAVAWVRARNCRLFKIETQNVNVAACRFYAQQGCHLGSIDRYGYAGDPRVAGEVMLLWYLELP